MAQLNAQLEELFNKFKDDDTGITKAGLTKFCVDCKFVDSKLKEADTGMIFEAVKSKGDPCAYQLFVGECYSSRKPATLQTPIQIELCVLFKSI